MQDLNPVLVQKVQKQERIENGCAENEFAPLSKAGLVENGVENGIAIHPALLESLTGQICSSAIDMKHTQAAEEVSKSEMRSIRQLNERPREGYNPRLRSKNAPINETVPSKRSKNARFAARCRHDNGSNRLKEDLRERNRIAAAKHRRKKRAAINALDEELRTSRTANEKLKRQTLAFRDQLSHWRMLALQHISGETGCQCEAIHGYNSTLMSEIMLGVERLERSLATSQTEDAFVSQSSESPSATSTSDGPSFWPL